MSNLLHKSISLTRLFLLGVLYAIALPVVSQETEKLPIITVFEDHEHQLTTNNTYALSWRLVEEALKNQKLELEVVPANWTSSINRLKDGRLTLVFGALRTQERLQWAQFSYPLLPEDTLLVSRLKSKSELDAFQPDVTKHTIGVILGSIQEALAKQLGFQHIYSARVRQTLEEMLISGRVDLALVQRSFPFDCKLPPCVTQIGDAYSGQHARIMGMKDNPEAKKLIKIINLGLEKVLKSGTEKVFMNQYDPQMISRWYALFEEEVRENRK